MDPRRWRSWRDDQPASLGSMQSPTRSSLYAKRWAIALAMRGPRGKYVAPKPAAPSWFIQRGAFADWRYAYSMRGSPVSRRLFSRALNRIDGRSPLHLLPRACSTVLRARKPGFISEVRVLASRARLVQWCAPLCFHLTGQVGRVLCRTMAGRPKLASDSGFFR